MTLAEALKIIRAERERREREFRAAHPNYVPMDERPEFDAALDRIGKTLTPDDARRMLEHWARCTRRVR
jgi:hypothetical protein